ncbi:MAG: DNA repair protein RecO [Hydrogenophilales bacterium 28-61-23]|nr:MAG: DNA repair protein RecO [Hydrogenophilales bacterium 28-61-23]
MSEKIDGDPAFVLHTRPWRETSLIVDVLSRHHGRVALVARGARRQASSLKTRLTPFQPLALSWFGKSQLRTLHDAEWQGGGLMLRGHALMCGFYLNELLLRLLPEGDAHEGLFDLYAVTLAALNERADVEPVLRRFELDLLSELGYAQPLGHLADGGELELARRYSFAIGHDARHGAGHGVVPLRRDENGYRGKTLLDLASGDLSDPATLAEGKILMRTLLAHYLGDKPLATRQLLIHLQQLHLQPLDPQKP